MNPNIRKLIEKYEADRNIYLTDRYNELCCFKTLWDRFEDVSIDQDECIDKVFISWKKVLKDFTFGIGLTRGVPMKLQEISWD